MSHTVIFNMLPKREIWPILYDDSVLSIQDSFKVKCPIVYKLISFHSILGVRVVNGQCKICKTARLTLFSARARLFKSLDCMTKIETPNKMVLQKKKSLINEMFGFCFVFILSYLLLSVDIICRSFYVWIF